MHRGGVASQYRGTYHSDDIWQAGPQPGPDCTWAGTSRAREFPSVGGTATYLTGMVRVAQAVLRTGTVPDYQSVYPNPPFSVLPEWQFRASFRMIPGHCFHSAARPGRRCLDVRKFLHQMDELSVMRKHGRSDGCSRLVGLTLLPQLPQLIQLPQRLHYLLSSEPTGSCSLFCTGDKLTYCVRRGSLVSSYPSPEPEQGYLT